MSEPAGAGPHGPGDEVGGFVIEAIAGRGGMGVVYRAHQKRPNRVVALKVIAPDLVDDPTFRVRFERESVIAAQIEHPNVIPVYAVDEDNGVLFIAMRFVAGVDLRTLITRARRLEPRRAARIVDQVAQALDAAHSHGLVHRDVKPANVLLSTTGGRDHAYLTDFGLSRHVEGSKGLTQSGAFLGTIDYVAPEQANANRVDARTDVYSLGCVLFHALTGTVPFPLMNDMAKLYAHSTQTPPSACKRAPGVPSAFDAVLRRAMAKAPDDRYRSAGDLGRAACASAASDAPSSHARTSVPESIDPGSHQPLVVSASDPRGSAHLGRGSVRATRAAISQRDPPSILPAPTSVLAGHPEGVLDMAFSPDGRVLASAGGEGSVRLWNLVTGQWTTTLRGHTAAVRGVAFSPNGRVLASGGGDGSVRLWDVARGEQLAKLEGHAGSVRGVAFSPDGSVLASGGFDGSVRLWDTASGEQAATLEGHTQAIRRVAFSPDGRILASAGGDRSLRLWDMASGEQAATLEGHTHGVRGVAFSPDGLLLASASDDRSVRLWDTTSGEPAATLEGHTRAVRGVVFSPGGRILASAGGNDRSVRIWDTISGGQTATLEGHTDAVRVVAFSPDGSVLASGGEDGPVCLWARR